MKILFSFLVFLLSCSFLATAQDNTPGPAEGKRKSAVYKSDKADDNSLMTFDGVKATSRINSKIIRKRNVGIGLTVAGAGLATIGSVLVATSSWHTYTYPSGASYTSTSAGGIIGLLMIPASIAITIPGAVLWGRYAHKIRKAQQAE